MRMLLTILLGLYIPQLNAELPSNNFEAELQMLEKNEETVANKALELVQKIPDQNAEITDTVATKSAGVEKGIEPTIEKPLPLKKARRVPSR